MRSYAPHVIVGVIGNSLNRDMALDTDPQIVIDSDQVAMEGFWYFVRSTLPASTQQSAIAQAIWRVDPEVQRVGARPLVEYVERSLEARRSLVRVLTVFGVL